MKKVWQIVRSSNKAVLSDPFTGTEQQAEAYMRMFNDPRTCELQEMDIVDLDNLTIHQAGDTIKTYYKDANLFELYKRQNTWFHVTDNEHTFDEADMDAFQTLTQLTKH